MLSWPGHQVMAAVGRLVQPELPGWNRRWIFAPYRRSCKGREPRFSLGGVLAITEARFQPPYSVWALFGMLEVHTVLLQCMSLEVARTAVGPGLHSEEGLEADQAFQGLTELSADPTRHSQVRGRGVYSYMAGAAAANITKRLWEIGDIIDVLEAWEANNAKKIVS